MMKKTISFFSFLCIIVSSMYSQNLDWVKVMSGKVSEAGQSIALDANGNIYITGEFIDTVDFDPGAGVNNLIALGAGNEDIFVQKLDPSGNLLWAKSMGSTGRDKGLAIGVDGLGNVYTTGWFEGTVDFDPNAGISNLTSVGDWDIFVQKLDTDGNLLWAKSMGSPDEDAGYSLAVDNAGNVYTTGRFHETLDIDPNAGTTNLVSQGQLDIFIQKLDAAGNFIWGKSMGGDGWEEGRVIAVDAAGNVYTTGTFRSDTVDFDPNAGIEERFLNGRGSRDVFVQKLDASGDLVWVKTMGGESTDVSHGLALDNSGNVYTTGTFIGMGDFDPNAGVNNLTALGFQDIFIQKLDAAGNFLWAKSIGGIDSEEVRATTIDNSGNLYTTGIYIGTIDCDPGTGTFNLSSAGGWDFFIQKLDAMGDLVWAESFGGVSTDFSYGLAVDPAENVFATGSFRETADFDPSPTSFNVSALGGTDIFVLKWGSGNNVGIDDLSEFPLKIYPNPNQGIFTVELPEDTRSAQITVLDIRGKTVFQRSLKASENELDLSNLAAGIYRIGMKVPAGKEYVGKLVLHR